MAQQPEPWYVTAFGADYTAVYPHRDLASARREVAWIRAQGIEGLVLDLCCGFGRHSLALAESGVRVVGVDLSHDLLLQAPAGIAPRLARGDARRVPAPTGAFDGVVNLFSSFGYFGKRGDLEVLREIRRVLRPGGRAVMDLMDPTRIRATLVPSSERRAADHDVLEVRRLVDGGRRVQKDVRLVFDDGHERSWTEDVRLYDGKELEAASGGLRLLDRFGSFGGEAWVPGSERQILLWERE